MRQDETRVGWFAEAQDSDLAAADASLESRHLHLRGHENICARERTLISGSVISNSIWTTDRRGLHGADGRTCGVDGPSTRAAPPNGRAALGERCDRERDCMGSPPESKFDRKCRLQRRRTGSCRVTNLQQARNWRCRRYHCKKKYHETKDARRYSNPNELTL